MSSVQDLKNIATARLKDAEALLAGGRFDGAIYLCGYAVETALKARICLTLKWSNYEIGRDYQSFRTHDLRVLLHLSGYEDMIRSKYLANWSIVESWRSETRYNLIGSVTLQETIDMIDSAKVILGAL